MKNKNTQNKPKEFPHKQLVEKKKVEYRNLFAKVVKKLHGGDDSSNQEAHRIEHKEFAEVFTDLRRAYDVDDDDSKELNNLMKTFYEEQIREYLSREMQKLEAV